MTKKAEPIRWVMSSASSAAVRARLAELNDYIDERVDAVNARLDPHRDEIDRKLARIVYENRSLRSKIAAIWKVADDMGALTGDAVACKRGCSHCCHIAVGVPRQEAELIGERIGRKPLHAEARTHFEDFDWGYHNPCAFLRDGECSIYEHRPLACRVHYSVDTDNVLCELSPPHTHQTPCLNTTQFTFALMQVCTIGTAGTIPHCADIREWFPREGSK